MRVLVIHNPAAGLRNDDIYYLIRQLAIPNNEIVLRVTGGDRDIESIASDAASFDAVVASGGDGTIARIAYAIRESGTPLLVFPSGTANLLANNIGNASEAASLAKTILSGRTVRFDMGEMRYSDTEGAKHAIGFLTMAGAGFDASIMRGSAGLKSTFGPFSYYMAAFGNPDPTISHFTLELDGEVVEADGICVLVGVWGVVNPGFELIPESSPRDGLLDVAIIKKSNATQLIPAFLGSILGQGINDPAIEVHHVRSLSVDCDPPLPMQFDGEVIQNATTPFTMRVLPGALSTFVDEVSPFSDLAKD